MYTTCQYHRLDASLSVGGYSVHNSFTGPSEAVIKLGDMHDNGTLPKATLNDK